MPSAKLTISVDGAADALRAFGKISGASKAANAALSADARRAKQEVTKLHEEEVKDALKAADAQVQSDMKLFDTKLKLAKQAGDRVAREIAAGVTTEENAAKRKEQIYRTLALRYVNDEEKKTRVLEVEEKKRTAATEREAKKRSLAAQTAGAAGGTSRLGAVMGAVSSVGGAVLGATDWAANHGSAMARMAAGAQEQLAPIDETLNRTLFQATGSNAEIQHRKQQMLDFARQNDMDPAVVASAAAEAQEKFSVLGNRSDSTQTRDQLMRDFLGQLSEARDFHQDPEEFTRLSGALSQGGLHGKTLQQTMRSLAGVAMRGGVELGNLTGEALRPLMAEVARAEPMGPEAVQEAVTRQVAMMEVLAPKGLGPLRAGNAVFDVGTELRSSRVTDNILHHIRNRFGANSQLESSLYQNGVFREDKKSGLAFGRAMTEAGMSPDDIRNMLGAETDRNTHHLIRQGLLKNQRNALASLAERQNGRTGYQRLVDIQEGAGLTERDRVQGHELAAGSLASRIQHAENSRMQALLANGAMVSLGEQQRDFEAENPYKNYMLSQVPGGATAKAAYVGGQAIGTAIAGNSVPVTLGAPVRLHPADVQAIGSAVGQQIPNADPHDRAHRDTVDASGPNGSPRHP